ncbi:MAG: glycosyltransferase family 2 protein [Bacteroidia bacterium]
MPKVSVIVPCFNSGHFLDETIDSALSSTFTDFEIIIVNDGSTDDFTNNLLANYNRPKTKVIHTENCGLVGARNNALKHATGEYILPLDADDLIGPDYMKEAVEYLDSHPNAGIVYCIAKRFGEEDRIWEYPEFTIERMLQHNLIFNSAFCRRKDIETVGGYSEMQAYHWEDWDMWLSIIELGRDVYKIPKLLHYYRVHKTSRTFTRDYHDKMKETNRNLYLRHLNLYAKHHPDPINLRIELTRLKTGSEEQIKWIYNTADYRLGHAILSPLRKIKSWFQK